MGKDIPPADSRLKDSLTPATALTWLSVFSKCGLEQQVELCIDFILKQHSPVDIDMTDLQPAHANKLLAAMQRKLSTANTEISQALSRINNAKDQRDKVVQSIGASSFYVNTCSSCNRRWISNDIVTCCGSKRNPTGLYLYLNDI
jgi:hypothetical protein